MPKITPEIESFARIKVVGAGGSGCNMINHMVNCKVKGVEFVATNTDAQHLHHSLAEKKVHIGKNLTRGLGTGMDPDRGKKAAEESLEDIQNVLKGADMVFVSCGMGGGTGTGAAPVIAKVARDQGALTVAVVTKPFFFEGRQRMMIADRGMEELSQEVDAIIAIPNDRILNIIDKNTTTTAAFALCDDILRQAVEGISNIITIPGIINVDFADIRAVMQSAGSALMGIGSASGENRASEAARAAINSPLLDISIDGAKGVLFTIAGGEDMTMFEIQEAAKVITESIDADAKVIFGAINDEKLKKNEVKVTVIATSFPNTNRSKMNSIFGASEDSVIPNTIPEPTKEKAREVREKDRDTVDIPVTNKPSFRSVLEKKIENTNELPNETTDDWSSIPAFLRRPKSK
jgi:cell division protein FtsZ